MKPTFLQIKYLEMRSQEKTAKLPVDMKLYDWLDDHGIMWGRKSDDNLWVRTQGYKTEDHYTVEEEMMKHGYFMLGEDFDSMSGQTVATYKKRKKLVAMVESMMNRIAAVDYNEYMKAHPRSKKQPNDPLFKQKGDAAAPKAAPAKAAPKAPAKTPTTKANPLDKLTPSHKKGVEFALDKMREYGYPEIAKKVQSGKMTLEEAGKFAENWNYHGLAAILRGKEGTDHALIQHAENRHEAIDLGDKPEDKQHYGTERTHMLDARYEADNPKQIGKETDRDRQRKLNALTYIHHHGLHDSDTAKRLHKEVEANKDAYKNTWANEAKYHDENVASQKKELDNFKPDPKHPNWTKKDQQAWYEQSQKAKDKHHEIGKKLGLV